MSVPKPSNHYWSLGAKKKTDPRLIGMMMMSAEYERLKQPARFDDADSQALEFMFGGQVRRELARIAADPRPGVKG